MSNLLIALMAPQGGDAGGGMISTVVMFALIIFIFYFMIIRPQSKRQKERAKMLEAMKKGDKVVTNGGLHGKIVGMEDKTVLLEIADNVKVKVEKSAIGAVLPE
ncbi:MAG: preprotein translocase subunit YajC [Bacteroidetes bacterium]|nr:preprotein translocase subunit YajC [Bacteroidota bacterium]